MKHLLTTAFLQRDKKYKRENSRDVGILLILLILFNKFK